jgi:hypothetical protein
LLVVVELDELGGGDKLIEFCLLVGFARGLVAVALRLLFIGVYH